jgi:hypothetical protein
MLLDYFSGRVFILGAGFSYFLSGGHFPLLRQLGVELSESLPWLHASANGPLDVERVLTDLDLEAMSTSPDDPRYDELTNHRTEVVRFISNRLSDMDISDSQIATASELCLSLFRPGDFVLTFNWDCLLEKLLWQAKVWTPYGGYGDAMAIGLHSSLCGLNPFFLTILKLHGSVNFAFPSYGGPRLTLFQLPDVFPGITAISNDSDDNTLPVVTLPTHLKRYGDNRSIRDVWTEATDAIRHAQSLVVIGYSFPIADQMARMLISFAGANERLDRVAILTGSENESLEIQSRIREVAELRRDRYAKESASFEENVEWAIFAAENGLGFSTLGQALSKWPTRNLEAAIFARATFEANLPLMKKLWTEKHIPKTSS